MKREDGSLEILVKENLDVSQAIATIQQYVGDMESDQQAAANAGCDFQWAQEFFHHE